MLTFKQMRKFEEVRSQLKVQCKCGTKTIIPMFMDRLICRNCGHWVYRDKKKEFQDKMREILKNDR